MHPPAFSTHHRLSDWPECRLELHCPSGSGRCVDFPVRLLLQSGDRPFGDVLAKLRCKCCGGKPAPVYLVAGLTRRPDRGGPPPCWAVELTSA